MLGKGPGFAQSTSRIVQVRASDGTPKFAQHGLAQRRQWCAYQSLQMERRGTAFAIRQGTRIGYDRCETPLSVTTFGACQHAILVNRGTMRRIAQHAAVR